MEKSEEKNLVTYNVFSTQMSAQAAIGSPEKVWKAFRQGGPQVPSAAYQSS